MRQCNKPTKSAVRRQLIVNEKQECYDLVLDAHSIGSTFSFDFIKVANLRFFLKKLAK